MPPEQSERDGRHELRRDWLPRITIGLGVAALAALAVLFFFLGGILEIDEQYSGPETATAFGNVFEPLTP